MNTNDLLAEVQHVLGGTATRGAAEIALHAVLRAIRDGLAEDGEVKLAGFGTFRVRQVAGRRLLMPGSRREHHLPPRRVLRFSPSPHLLAKHKSESRTQKQLPSSP